MPCAFLGKSVEHTFPCRKCILFKKKDVSNFSCCFKVMVTSQSDEPIICLFNAWKLSTMNSSWHKHVLFDQLWYYYWRPIVFGTQTLTQNYKEVTLTSKRSQYKKK